MWSQLYWVTEGRCLTTCSYLNSRGVATDYVEDYLGVVSALLGERR